MLPPLINSSDITTNLSNPNLMATMNELFVSLGITKQDNEQHIETVQGNPGVIYTNFETEVSIGLIFKSKTEDVKLEYSSTMKETIVSFRTVFYDVCDIIK